MSRTGVHTVGFGGRSSWDEKDWEELFCLRELSLRRTERFSTDSWKYVAYWLGLENSFVLHSCNQIWGVP